MTPPIPLEEAQAKLIGLVKPVSIEHTDVAGTLGRFLAGPLIARRTQPACDLSAMDGYAMRPDDLSGPWQVIGESAAGHPFGGSLDPGQTVRIATGALMPQTADAVILQEDITRTGEQVTLTGDLPAPHARHIRRIGMDFNAGDELLAAGTRIGPAQMALAISSGHSHLPVRRPVRLAVIDSGDELSRDCENCLPHQIPASNGIMLAAMASSESSVIKRLGPVSDNLEALADALARADDSDVIVTSGGVSVGDHDLIRPALAAWGAEIAFWRIAIRPGKPLLVATRERPRGRQIIIGLPGNPVSSYVTAYLFLLPLIRALAGSTEPLPRAIPVRLAAPLRATGKRREFVRAHWDGATVMPLDNQDSSALGSLAHANALISRGADTPASEIGGQAEAFLFENGGVA